MGRNLTTQDLLTLDAVAIRERYQEGSLTCLDLVNRCLQQIKKHDRQNANLRAVISVAPHDLLQQRALELDEERVTGHKRADNALHGIPILVKDAIATGAELGMRTTVGNYALQDSQPPASPLTSKLHELGAIIIAKTNLNEFCGVKGFSKSNGWSALGGQTQSAYVPIDPEDTDLGHTSPCGSSTGSAVGVSAGYAPIALGTESIGSLFSPATRAALFALKPTVGSVDMSGVWPVSKVFDAVGGMAKSVSDLAAITECLITQKALDSSLNSTRFKEVLPRNFAGLKIGFLDTEVWGYPPEVVSPIESVATQIRNHIESAVRIIGWQKDVQVVYPVSLPPLSIFSREGRDSLMRSITYEIVEGTMDFLQSADVNGITSIKDVVDFNERHQLQELPKAHPDQKWLMEGLNERPNHETYGQDIEHFRKKGCQEGIDKLFLEHDLNLLAFSADSLVFTYASAAGYPIATMPLGILHHKGRPFGLGIIAQAGREDLMFQFMSAFEIHFPARAIPNALL